MFLVCGDFNTQNISWKHQTNSKFLKPENYHDNRSLLLVDTLVFCGFKQYNFLKNSHNHVIDLVPSNINFEISISHCSNLIVHEDTFHRSIGFDIFINLNNKLDKVNKTCVNKFNYNLTNFATVDNDD